MAFNPFTWFRKHQKVLFAGLTILCMVVFIGQFGSGDVFSRALLWFGGSRAAGETVTTLYGTKVREGELTRLARQRKLANDFVFNVAWEGHQKACKELLDGPLKSGSGLDNPLAGLREIVAATQTRTGFGLVQAAFRTPGQLLRFQIENDLNQLEGIAAREQVRNDPERLALLQRVATMLGFQFWLAEPTRLRGALDFMQSMKRVYPREWAFGGSEKIEDLLDFRLWQLQADRLGIRLTDEDVLREIITTAGGVEFLDPRSSFELNPEVRDFLTTSQPSGMATPFTGKDLLDALREEFRVIMAQAILLGSEPGIRAYRLALGATSSPALATPDEFLHFFREQRTALRVKFLTIPASRFLDQVKDQPTPAELRTRFDLYKDREPNPGSREPGFKEPRRILVEYVTASPQNPYYRDLGRARLLSWAAWCISTGSPLASLTAVIGDPLHQEYDADLKANDFAWYYNPRDSLSMLEERTRKLHYTSVIQTRPLVGLFASLAANPSPLLTLSSLYGGATFEEVRTSAVFTFTQLLAQASPENLFGNAALIAAALPSPPSYRLMEPQLLAAVAERVSEEELRKNLQKFRDELGKFRGRTDAGKDYVAKAAKEYHLQLYSMPRPMTQNDLIASLKKQQDMNLKVLREAVAKVARSDKVDLFVGDLFLNMGTYEPVPFSLRDPQPAEFLFWRSQDLPSRPREFLDVRDQVAQAWKLERARQLASKEAERIEDEINKQNGTAADSVRILQERGTSFGPIFELEGISQLIAPREVLPARRTEYTPYVVPEEKSEYLEYPPADLAKQLMTLKRPGQATVIVNQPATTFFVAVLLERSEPSIEEFKRVYARTPKEDTLYSIFLTHRRADYRKAVLDQLRREAGKVDKQGHFEIPDSIRRRETGTIADDE